jgi:phosphoribosylaminoimidazole-succinocarboxamide synthase
VRGYITGSGWKDYQAHGTVSGVALPEGLQESEQLPEPIFTPSTKAEEGHDEAIDLAGRRACRLEGLGGAAARRVDRVYAVATTRASAGDPRRHEARVRPRRRGRARPRRRGLHAGLLALLARRGLRARPRPAVVRQAVRPRLGERHGLGQAAARAEIPDDVVAATRERYVKAYELLAGEPFARWLERVGAPA